MATPPADVKQAQSLSDWRATEQRSPRFKDLAAWPIEDTLAALFDGQQRAIHSLYHALSDIQQAVELATLRLATSQGRLIYCGAGTSGRLGVLDAVELRPTFNWPDSRIVNLFAGGSAGVSRAVEGAEDNIANAKSEAKKAKFNADDVVIGIAASGTTPYTRTLLQIARQQGALTIALANNPNSPMLDDAEVGILLNTGPEVLAGSTRLAAGTSQKATLNLFSTALMVNLGKVHEGYMVDMVTSNDKLKERAVKMVASITHCSEHQATTALSNCDGIIKLAVLNLHGLSKEASITLLSKHQQHLGKALLEIS